MDHLILDPAIAWEKFNYFVWFSTASLIGVYIAVRVEAYFKFKETKWYSTLLKCLFLPCLLMSTGYNTHLDKFYAIEMDEFGQLNLAMVYPEGKSVALGKSNAKVAIDRSGCSVVIYAGSHRYESLRTRDHFLCKKIIRAVNQSEKKGPHV